MWSVARLLNNAHCIRPDAKPVNSKSEMLEGIYKLVQGLVQQTARSSHICKLQLQLMLQLKQNLKLKLAGDDYDGDANDSADDEDDLDDHADAHSINDGDTAHVEDGD